MYSQLIFNEGYQFHVMVKETTGQLDTGKSMKMDTYPIPYKNYLKMDQPPAYKS